MDKVNIGESTLKDFGNVINEAADILNKGKVAFDNSIPDKTLQVLPYTGQAGALIPSKIGNLDDLTTTAKDNLVNAINEVNDSLKGDGFVTLDTEQTITGNKFFQANDEAEHFVKFYPTPKQIPIGGDTFSTYTAHLQGRILAGDTGGDEYNPKSLWIGVPTYSPLTFFGYSQGFGGVRFESSDFGGQIGGVFYETGHNNNLYKCDGASFVSQFYSNSATFLVGRIQANNQNEYFDGTPDLENAILMDSNDGLIFRVGYSGKIYVNDQAKSEFQRVLEIPSLTEIPYLTRDNSFSGENTFMSANFLSTVSFDSVCSFNATSLFYGDVSIRNISINGECDLGYLPKTFGLQINKLREGKELILQGTNNGVEFNLGDTATLTLNARMISELKRVLGIQ